jgi:hypothetical protein
MKNLYCSLIVFLFFTVQTGNAQQKPGRDSKGGIPTLSFFLAGDYFSPKLTDVDAIFQTIEKNYSLPAGTDFKNYYSVLTGFRFAPVQQQSVQIEFGGSLSRSEPIGVLGDNRSASFMQLYYTGATYLFNPPVGPINIFVGGGLGYVWLNAQRSYAEQPGVARINAGLTQLHGIGGVEYVHPTGVTFSLEGGYSYAITLFPQRSDIDYTIKGFTAGIKLGVPIVKTF